LSSPLSDINLIIQYLKENKEMQVVVLLGGLGTRLKNRQAHLPKAMVDVHGRPFFYYQLQLMKQYGLKDFVFCIGYKGEAIKNFFKNGRHMGVSIKYSSDGKTLLGTAGALKKAAPFLKDDFMVIYGDSYMDVDYARIIFAYRRFKRKGSKALLTVLHNKNKFDKSNVIFRNNRLLKYDKKNPTPKMEYIDYGVSILDKKLLGLVAPNKYFDLSDLYSIITRKGLMAGYEVSSRFYEIGTPSALAEFKNYIYQRVLVKKPVVFLDRDGTLNRLCIDKKTGQADSPLRPEELRLLPKTIASLRAIKSLGYAIVVVTNQPAAAKGKTTLEDIYKINDRLRDVLVKRGVILDDLLLCPHHPVGAPHSKERELIKECECRKPRPGMLSLAIEKLNLDRSGSYMVGDSCRDILAGRSVKVKTVFLGEYKGPHQPEYIFKNLYEFALFLKRTSKKRKNNRGT
jgi:histidinol-phosphate phosphatase family protein